MKQIADTVVGLKTYEAFEASTQGGQKKLIEYIEFTESHNDPKYSIWSFICAFILFGTNLIGKNIKNDFDEEYTIRKVVESFFSMKAINQNDFDNKDVTSRLNIQEINISNKLEL